MSRTERRLEAGHPPYLARGFGVCALLTLLFLAGPVIWSGLSWGVGEVRHDQIAPGKPIRIRLSTAESDPSLNLDGRVYRVEY
jgi:hypothetical protein